jgi:hypothetical protein
MQKGGAVMADLDFWTKEDDDLVRGALASLREDVYAEPLPEPAFVRARGRKDGRRTAVLWAAGVAAAAVTIAAVGFGALGRDDAQAPLPGGSVSVTRPTPSTSASVEPVAQTPEQLLQIRSTWPVALEWQRFLGLEKEPAILEQPAGDFAPVCGPLTALPKATLAADLRVVADPAKLDETFLGVQRHFTFPSQAALRDAFTTMSSAITACDIPGTTSSDITSDPTTWNGQPQIWWFTVNDQQRGYIGIATAGSEMLYVEAHGRAASHTPFNGFPDLMDQAKKRLGLYGLTVDHTGGSATPPASPSANNTNGPTGGSTTPSSAAPIVLGPHAAKLTADLFLTEAEWSSVKIPGGKLVHSEGAFEGSSAVIECDPDSAADGTFGIQRAKRADNNVHVGVQRIRLFSGSQASIDSQVAAYMGSIRTAMDKGCSTENTTVTATRGSADDTWKVVTTFKDNSPTLTEWVAIVRPMKSGLVSTVSITSPAGITDDATGFTAITDLLVAAAARQ